MCLFEDAEVTNIIFCWKLAVSFVKFCFYFYSIEQFFNFSLWHALIFQLQFSVQIQLKIVSVLYIQSYLFPLSFTENETFRKDFIFFSGP